jgi:hypothetical protein
LVILPFAGICRFSNRIRDAGDGTLLILVRAVTTGGGGFQPLFTITAEGAFQNNPMNRLRQA